MNTDTSKFSSDLGDISIEKIRLTDLKLSKESFDYFEIRIALDVFGVQYPLNLRLFSNGEIALTNFMGEPIKQDIYVMLENAPKVSRYWDEYFRGIKSLFGSRSKSLPNRTFRHRLSRF